MTDDNRVVAIDVGNTSIKGGYFLNGILDTVARFDVSNLNDFYSWLNNFGEIRTVISSVVSLEHTSSIVKAVKNPMIIDVDSDTPFLNLYESKETLGIDRICNATYINNAIQTGCAVSIDIGTCIKFDLVNEKNEYLGGSISPGINLRYRSLNEFTGNLPLLSNKSAEKLVGNTTESSICSGVMNGLKAEIQNLMQKYEDIYPGLTFFVTGGDAKYFELHSKNDIFADENLTIKGLFEIYMHNA
jgi:type III pantothenate kinase